MKISKLLILLAPLCLINCGGGGNDVPDPASKQTPLCITCTSDGGGLLCVCQFSTEAELSNLQYSRDNKNWQNVDFVASQWPKILNKGETYYFRGDNPDGFNHVTFDAGGTTIEGGRCTSFLAAEGTFNVGGNVMSLIKSDGFDTLTDIPSDFCFAALFSLNEEVAQAEAFGFIVDATNLSLPAVNLKTGCYYQMFRRNAFLTNSPYLPATSLAEDCYTQMFEYCASLKKVQVAFKEAIFDTPIKYTQDWLNLPLSSNDDKRVFVWPGDIGEIERNENTVPDGWEIQKIEL